MALISSLKNQKTTKTIGKKRKTVAIQDKVIVPNQRDSSSMSIVVPNKKKTRKPSTKTYVKRRPSNRTISSTSSTSTSASKEELRYMERVAYADTIRDMIQLMWSTIPSKPVNRPQLPPHVSSSSKRNEPLCKRQKKQKKPTKSNTSCDYSGENDNMIPPPMAPHDKNSVAL